MTAQEKAAPEPSMPARRKRPTGPPLPRLAFSPREVGDQLGLSYESVLDAIHAGEIPAVRIGRHYRVPAVDLARLLAPTPAAGAAT
jgi:excisionase family DNA binding protein